MRRKWIISLSVGGTVLLASALWQISFSGADPATRAPAGQQVQGKGENAGKPPDAALPIRQVVLFNTGVGYFQREGQVDGSSRVELSFPASDMNDLLKSLILQDGGGGKVSAVSYDSYDPIEKTLRSFAIDLSSNPTFGQILNQTRGEKIELVRVEKIEKKEPDKKEPAKIDVRTTRLSGIIVGMESLVKANDPREIEILNLTTADGLQAVPLEQVVSVRFMNATLEKEFQRALQVLARAHDTQKKTISLGFQGNGKRTVRVGYVVERPIWKTSYRLRIEDGKKLFMQAWAMVENTSDDDWTDVDMILVAGRPISYKMNLYEPLYIPRPFVEPELFASLRPPVYSGSFGPEDAMKDVAADKKLPPMNQQPAQKQQEIFNLQQTLGPQFGQGQFGQFGNPFGNFQGGFQGGWGQFGQMGQGQPFNNRYSNNTNMVQGLGNYNLKLTYEQLQERQRNQKQAQDEARRVVGGLNFKEGVASVANAEEVGDYYQYALDQKINLPRQKSALLPIMNQAIQGTKVSIYNASVQSKFPLLGLRLRNSSNQPLTQGPITVYEGQTYAGDTRILDLQPGEERLLSYALDQGTEVVTTDTQSPGQELYFKVGTGDLATNYKVLHTRTYTLKNRSTHDRALVIEHPITSGHKLLEPEKAAEKSRDVYRFDVAVAAGKTVVFKVTEEEDRDAHVKFLVEGYTRSCDARDDIHVKLVSQSFAPKIKSMRFEKGVLHLKNLTRESTTYFVQNLSTQDRQCNIDYVVRADWKLLLEQDEVKAGPAVHRVQLKLPAKKTAVKEFMDERIVAALAPALEKMSAEEGKSLLANPAGSAEVKNNLAKALDMLAKLGDAKKRNTELEKQLKALTDDQARMRDNLSIIPQSSDPYKKFLEKFVSQETQIEALQKQVREVQASVQTMQRDYDLFIANLTVE